MFLYIFMRFTIFRDFFTFLDIPPSLGLESCCNFGSGSEFMNLAFASLNFRVLWLEHLRLANLTLMVERLQC